MNKKGLSGYLIFATLVLLLIGIYFFMIYSSIDNIKIKVKDKERINKRQDSYYLIFTENEVFKNEDSLLFFKFDSSDVYNSLEIGNEYCVQVNWYRFPCLSMYRNIIKQSNECN